MGLLLRRITEHVKTQNWTAVALDFAIVVVGVFMGIQLGNLNEALSDRKALRAALSNLELETQANLNIIDAMNRKIDAAIEEVEEARLALAVCVDDATGRQVVSSGVVKNTPPCSVRF